MSLIRRTKRQPRKSKDTKAQAMFIAVALLVAGTGGITLSARADGEGSADALAHAKAPAETQARAHDAAAVSRIIARIRNGAIRGDKLAATELAALAEVYVEWRTQLSRYLETVEGIADPRERDQLVGISTRRLARALHRMSQDPRWSEAHARLRPQALQAYAFLRELALERGSSPVAAMETLATRVRGFNFLDEPAFREELLEAMRAKLVAGASLDPATVSSQMTSYVKGLSVPGHGLRSHAFETVAVRGENPAPSGRHAVVSGYLSQVLERLEKDGASTRDNGARIEAIRRILVSLAEITARGNEV